MDVALKAMMAELAPVIRDFVSESLVRKIAPLKEENEALRARIATLEERQPEKGEQGERGEDGVSPDPEAVAEAFSERLKQMVDEAVAAIPPPQPGPPGEKGEQGERGEKGEAGADGSNGRDGAGIVDGFVSRDGHLIATLSDGSTKDFGEIIGKDGRDGAPGKNGRDGFGFDDMEVCVADDDRTIELGFRRGDELKVFAVKWPTVIDRGVWSEKGEYSRGDGTTWGGCFWIAQRDNPGKPDTAEGGWRLAVKKGRDGKGAKVG